MLCVDFTWLLFHLTNHLGNDIDGNIWKEIMHWVSDDPVDGCDDGTRKYENVST